MVLQEENYLIWGSYDLSIIEALRVSEPDLVVVRTVSLLYFCLGIVFLIDVVTLYACGKGLGRL